MSGALFLFGQPVLDDDHLGRVLTEIVVETVAVAFLEHLDFVRLEAEATPPILSNALEEGRVAE